MKEFIRRHKIASVLIVLSVGAAISLGLYWRNANAVRENFVKLKKGSIIEAVYGIGTVNAHRIFELKVGVPVTIDQLFVEEGDLVGQGDKLLSLVGLPTFRAPFAGTITKRSLRVGETAFPQNSILTLTDMTDRYVVVSIEQEGVIKITPGQNARLSFESLREEKFMGVVEAVYASESRFLVRIGVANLSPKLLPGMTADVSITIGKHENVWLIPVAAINSGKITIRRIGDTQRQEIDVEVKLVDGELAEVVSEQLRDGDAILSP